MWVWLLAFAFAYWLYRELWAKRQKLPPGPTPLPIVGNTLQIDPLDIETTLTKWRKQYGDTFTFWLGNQANVVVSGPAELREYFTSAKSADAFAGRPEMYTFEAFYGRRNAGMVFSWGDIWRETRRFSMHVLRDFGVGKSIMEDSIREEGANMNTYFEELLGGQARNNLDPTEPITICVINVISRIIFGHAYQRKDEKLLELRDVIAEATEVFGSTPVLLLMTNPWLRHIPVLDHFGVDTIKKASDLFYGFIDRECSAIRKAYDVSEEPVCFVEAYFREMEERKANGKDPGAFEPFQLSRTVGDFWSAGFETTVTTLRWGVVYMTRNPDVQAKIHAELDAFYGDDAERQTTMEDRLSLPYTQGAINEVQRMANIIPLNIQHSTTRDVTVGKYDLPANTTIVPNVGSVLKDERVFAEPDEFRPERFVKDGKPAKVEEFLPFGLGKRMCAGEPLAKMELFILFTMLLRRYSFSVSPSHGPPPMDTAAGQVRKPKPYTVTVTDRLHKN